jgi:hypothetical protein
MLTRVSNIEVYRGWMHWSPLHDDDVEPTVEQIVDRIVKDEPSEAMKAGSAFHKALELAQEGGHDEFAADGYMFRLPDAELSLPSIRELRAYHAYGDLTVTGKTDGIEGKVVIDHKTTSKVDLERYLEGCQWRFYLDIFEADVFRWIIWPMREVATRIYAVSEPQILEARRYPELHQDCVELAAEYAAFARQMNLPDARID